MTLNEIFELVQNNEINKLEEVLMSNPSIIDIEDDEGSTLLSTAVYKNNVPIVRLLINQGANLEKKYPIDDDTVLMSATYANYYKIVKVLIENGANINYKNDLGFDALYYASSKSYFEIQDLLLKNGAEKTHFSDTSLIYASSKGDLDKVKLLIEKVGVDLVNYDGKTALMEACLGGHSNVAKILIDRGADITIETPNVDDDMYRETPRGETAFFYAIIKGNISTVKLFGERKGVVSVISTDEYCSRTALMFASEYGNVEVVKYLLTVDFAGLGIGNGARQIDDSGKTALIYASLNGHSEVVELLIKHCDINHQDYQGKTALMYASEKGDIDIAKLLIEKDAKIYLKNRNGGVALKYPYDKNDEEMVEFMLENGANEKNIYDEGKTFFDHARYTNKKWFLDLILKINSLKNPKRLVEILTDFTNETPIKYTTHDWKNRIPEKYNKNFSEFLNDVKQQFSKIEDELKKLSRDLHQTIYDFIINKKNTTSWSSLHGLEEYVNNGGEPSEYKINGISFGDIINEFKYKIEFRNNEDQLRSIFDKWKCKLGRTFKLNIDDSLNGISIYTDTELFTNVIDGIFKDIQEKRSTFKEIEVKLIKQDFNYVELYIIHKNSKANRSAEEMLERFEFEKGDIQGIGKNLANLCDWSIESADSDGQRYRVNYLKSEDMESIEDLKTVSPDFGFTHIFRFYK